MSQLPMLVEEKHSALWQGFLIMGLMLGLLISIEAYRMQRDDNIRLTEENLRLKEENYQLRSSSRGFVKLLDDLNDLWK